MSLSTRDSDGSRRGSAPEESFLNKLTRGRGRGRRAETDTPESEALLGGQPAVPARIMARVESGPTLSTLVPAEPTRRRSPPSAAAAAPAAAAPAATATASGSTQVKVGVIEFSSGNQLFDGILNSAGSYLI